MDALLQYLPYLIPLILIQFALAIFALVDLYKQEKTRGPKWVWLVIILFVNFIGPIIYFVLGRDET